MSRKPETTFIASIHKHLKDVYYEKMNNPYRSGGADVWYSGVEGDLWVEYKYIPSLPRTKELVPNLSAMQLKWLADRHAEGRNVAVILGFPQGGIVYRFPDWTQPQTRVWFETRFLERPDLARWIKAQVGRSPCRSLEPSPVLRSP